MILEKLIPTVIVSYLQVKFASTLDIIVRYSNFTFIIGKDSVNYLALLIFKS